MANKQGFKESPDELSNERPLHKFNAQLSKYKKQFVNKTKIVPKNSRLIPKFRKRISWKTSFEKSYYTGNDLIHILELSLNDKSKNKYGKDSLMLKRLFTELSNEEQQILAENMLAFRRIKISVSVMKSAKLLIKNKINSYTFDKKESEFFKFSQEIYGRNQKDFYNKNLYGDLLEETVEEFTSSMKNVENKEYELNDIRNILNKVTNEHSFLLDEKEKRLVYTVAVNLGTSIGIATEEPNSTTNVSKETTIIKKIAHSHNLKLKTLESTAKLIAKKTQWF